MIVLAALVVALALLIFGLIDASAPLLIASLVVSLIAGVFVLRSRGSLGAKPASTMPADRQADAHDGGLATAAAPAAEDIHVWVIDGRPRYHRQDCDIVGANGEPIPRSQAIEDGFIACSLCQPDVSRIR
jgi:hypothetical protein